VISGHTALYGLMGHPVAHTLSPAMHNAAFAHLGIDAAYVALPVVPEALPQAVHGAHALGFHGLNVTVPHKRRVAALCIHLDRIADEVGAVNTLRRVAEGWEGYNTDALACRDLLGDAGVGQGVALVIGAGGAARALVWALLERGAQVRIAARRSEAAEDLCRQMTAALKLPPSTAVAVDWSNLAGEVARAEVVANATPIGLQSRLERLPPFTFQRGQLAVDLVYGDTAFIRAATAAGARLIHGEQLLLRQGALALGHWLGRPAPEKVMGEALRRAGGAR
jgi:shikimate dehydrogenase